MSGPSVYRYIRLQRKIWQELRPQERSGESYIKVTEQFAEKKVIRKINEQVFIEFVNISTELIWFSCENQYYDQNEILLFGSPRSPTYAELHIQRTE